MITSSSSTPDASSFFGGGSGEGTPETTSTEGTTDSSQQEGLASLARAEGTTGTPNNWIKAATEYSWYHWSQQRYAWTFFGGASNRYWWHMKIHLHSLGDRMKEHWKQLNRRYN